MAVSMFRWFEVNIFYAVRSVPSYMRWPEIGLESFRWPEFDFSVFFDDMLWTVMVVFETLTLITAVCFFYVFCGCSI